MIISATTDDIILLNAAPITTAVANATMSPFKRNFLKS